MSAITCRLGWLFLMALTLSCTEMLPISSRSNSSSIDGHTVNYLMKFGYLPQVNLEVANLQSNEILQNALKNLQRFANIPETGIVDDATKILLKSKRCGLPDFDLNNSFRQRKKRYTLQGQYWKHKNLTWSLQTRYIQGLHNGYVRSVLSRALNIWSNYSKLTFQEIGGNEADINIYFLRGHHGDGYPFDGKGQILAHAFFPGTGRGGDAHFDEDENWIIGYNDRDNDGTSLFLVAAHEFGHSLGLSHSNVKGALMFPFYQSTGMEFELPLDDQYAIQQLYGSKEDKIWGVNVPYVPKKYIPRKITTTTTTTTTTTLRPVTNTHRRHHNEYHPYIPRYSHKHPYVIPTHTYPKRKYNHFNDPRDNEIPLIPKPNTCDTSYDAVSIIRSEVFMFKDKYLWRIGDRGLYEGYPAEIRRMFPQLPQDLTHVDAVYERLDGKIVFFLGRLYYIFDGNTLVTNYPKYLVQMGLPSSLDKIDAAFIWGYNKQTYLFADQYYWKFDEDIELVENDYPRKLNTFWRGIGTNIDAAFQWKDGKTYFFKGKGFWKFDDLRNRVESTELTQSSSFWMGCPHIDNDNDIPIRKEPFVANCHVCNQMYIMPFILLLSVITLHI